MSASNLKPSSRPQCPARSPRPASSVFNPSAVCSAPILCPVFSLALSMAFPEVLIYPACSSYSNCLGVPSRYSRIHLQNPAPLVPTPPFFISPSSLVACGPTALVFLSICLSVPHHSELLDNRDTSCVLLHGSWAWHITHTHE